MLFWTDEPLDQWIGVQKDPHHLHPYSVLIAGYVRARCTTLEEALTITRKVKQAFGEPPF